MKILLVEDDQTIADRLVQLLTTEQYVVDTVRDGETGWTYGVTFGYDLIVLDVVLPGLSGIQLCQKFRTEGYTMPILLLTAQDSPTAKVAGLNAGADDYIVKPFNVPELIARVRALLRRGSAQNFPILAWGDLSLNLSTSEVSFKGYPLILTAKEYGLLELLLQGGHPVVSNDEILDSLWSSEEFPAEATVRSHMRRLRRKLTQAGAPPDFISTIHGRGYYLKPTAQANRATSHPHPQEALEHPSAAWDDAQAQPTAASEPIGEPPTTDIGRGGSAAQQARYSEFLNTTWASTRVSCLDQLNVLLRVASALQSETLSTHDQTQACQIAHKLAGTLGLFNITKGTSQARRLEQLLDSAELLQPSQAPKLLRLTARLCREIVNATEILPPNIDDQDALTASQVFIVGIDDGFNTPLLEVADSRGIQTVVVPSLDAFNDWLANYPEQMTGPGSDIFPQVLLFRPPTALENWRDTLTELTQQHPQLCLVILNQTDNFCDRLKVVQYGWKYLCESSMTAAEIITYVSGILSCPSVCAKVLVLDDDREWLTALPKLLQPWPFQITTLDNPQQFWSTLQSVKPDALILDVKMPQIDGFELCQVLRSDPHWQHLPVLFVSVLSDATAQSRAFHVGADDYLCKPIAAQELAQRLHHRIQRLKEICHERI